MKKILSAVVITMLLVMTITGLSAGAADLAINPANITNLGGMTVDGMKLVSSGAYGLGQYDFAADNQATGGSMEIDFTMHQSGTWYNFWVAYGSEKLKLSLVGVGNAYDENGEPMDNVTVILTKGSTSAAYKTVYTTLDYQKAYKISFIYSLLDNGKITSSLYIDGIEILKNIEGDYSDTIPSGTKSQMLYFEGATATCDNIKWSSDITKYVPAMTVLDSSSDEFEKGKANADLVIQLSQSVAITGLKIGNTVLTANDYTYDAENWLLTIKKEFINTLDVGNYTVELINGQTTVASQALKIAAIEAPPTSSNGNTSSKDNSSKSDNNNPQTGENTGYVFFTLFVVILTATLVAYKRIKA